MTKWQKFVAMLLVIAGAVFCYRIFVGIQAASDRAEKRASPQGQLPDTVVPHHYSLNLRIDPEQDSFTGSVTIDVEVHKPVRQLWLHGERIRPLTVQLHTDKASIDLQYKEMGNSGVVRLKSNKTILPQKARLILTWEADFNQQLLGLYKVWDNGRPYVVSQFQPVSARQAFPGFDEPRFKTTYDVSLEIPAHLKGFTNTPQSGQIALPDGFKRLTFDTSKPLPTYLTAFAVGDFDVVEYEPIAANDIRDTAIPLRGITVKGKGAGLEYALANTAAILTPLERYFGTPYPYQKLDLVAVPDFAAGAMENPGLITYREQLLLLGDAPSYRRQRNFAELHAHELAHQWFGNLVTMPWWDDIWLNEAFATWLAVKTADQWRPDFEFDRQILHDGHWVMDKDALASSRQVREPVTNNDVIGNAFDAITYQKGGAVLQMMSRFIGEDHFRRGIQLHMKRFAFGHAGAFQFIDSLAQVSEKGGVKASFISFLAQPGLPAVNLQWQCDSDGVNIEVSQQRFLVDIRHDFDVSAKQWGLPICMTLVADKGQSHRVCRLLESRSQRFAVPGDCPAAVMPNANGDGYYRYRFDKTGWQTLLANLDHLTPGEQYSVANNLAAAFQVGDVDATFYLGAAAQFVKAKAWDLQVAPLRQLQYIDRYIVSDDEKPQLKRYLSGLYKPVMDELGLVADTEADKANPVATALLRRRVASFMALRMDEPSINQAFLKAAKAYIGFEGDGKLNEAAITQDLAQTAMTVGVRKLGAPYFEALQVILEQSSDSAFRQRAIYALGSTTDPELAEAARGMLMSGTLKNNERPFILYAQLRYEENLAGIFDWVQSYLGLLSNVLPQQVLVYAPVVARGFCDADKAEQVQQFFDKAIGHLTGMKQHLDSTVEQIRNCAAIKARHQGIDFSVLD